MEMYLLKGEESGEDESFGDEGCSSDEKWKQPFHESSRMLDILQTKLKLVYTFFLDWFYSTVRHCFSSLDYLVKVCHSR